MEKRRAELVSKLNFLTDPEAKAWIKAAEDGWSGIERYVAENSANKRCFFAGQRRRDIAALHRGDVGGGFKASA